MRVCVDRYLSSERIVRAADSAGLENPDNRVRIIGRPGIGGQSLSRPAIAALSGKKWANGRTLRVSFMGGDLEVQERIKRYAHEWSVWANIFFQFGNAVDAEIRISFEPTGSWSYIGTDALQIPPSQATMNFGWLTPDTSEDEYSRVVLHEFGHALGCIHEHQSPTARIPWDKAAVYAYYRGWPNHWSQEDVDFNIFQKYAVNQTQFSEFDPHSIMLYPIPNEFTIGDWEIPWNNTELSETDTAFMGTIYPLEIETTSLIVDAPALLARIGEHEEVDRYSMRVARGGVHRIETFGWTDVVMSLFDSNGELLDQDDDSGNWLNAELVLDLLPGPYTVTVRHYHPRRKGEYRIYAERVMS